MKNRPYSDITSMKGTAVNNELKAYIVGLAIGAAIGASGTMVVVTKKKIKNLNLRLAARKELIADMQKITDPTMQDIINIIQRSSDIDNMPH